MPRRADSSPNAVFEGDGNTNTIVDTAEAEDPEEAGDPEEYNDPDEDLEEDVEVATEAQVNDTPGQAVFRYFQLLTAWVTAAKVVPHRLRKLGGDPIGRLDVTFVRLKDGSAKALEDVHAHVGAVVEDLKRLANKRTTDPQTLEHVYQWIDIHCKLPERERHRPIRVHAEAGLMALLQRLQSSSEDADELVTMLGMLGGVRTFASAVSIRHS